MPSPASSMPSRRTDEPPAAHDRRALVQPGVRRPPSPLLGARRSRHTLVAAHPKLEDDFGTDAPERFSDIAGLANVLVAHITETASALERYTAQVRQEREREPHFPF